MQDKIIYGLLAIRQGKQK